MITFSPPEISVIAGEPAQLHASVSGNIASIVWKSEEALLTPKSLTSATIPLLQDTVLNLTIVDANGCTSSKELIVKVLCKLYMPSAFTPNNDGKNDVFHIPPGSSLILHEFSIFDRSGNAIFRTSDITREWNGIYQGHNLDAGTYVCILSKDFFKAKM